MKLPEKDREGQPIMFDSYDLSPVLFGTGKSPRKEWFYFTENELSPGAARVGNYKAVFNLRGDNGAVHRRSRRGHQPRLEGRGEICRHRAADLRPVAGPAGALRHLHEQLHRAHLDDGPHRPRHHELMKTYVKYPPRKLQSMGYDGPIEISKYQQFQWVRES